MFALRPKTKNRQCTDYKGTCYESMADQILSIWSIRDSEPDAVGVGAVE